MCSDMLFSIMYTHVAWLSFSRLISVMFCELPLIYFYRLPERKLLSGGVVRRPIRIFWNVQNIPIGPANRSLFVLRRRTSYRFVPVPIGSYLIAVHSYRFVVHSHWDSPPVCCDSVRCNTMRNHSEIVLILHHHRTASCCIVSPSCCILLHLTASYQFVFNSCLIRIDSQIIIVSNRSG